MGTLPAPPYTTLYFAIHENRFVPKYRSNVALYKHFIDDVIGIWLPYDTAKEDDALWSNFGKGINSYQGLKWIVTKCTTSLDFMDLTITIDSQTINTTLYEKKLNIHQYITLGSVHPPGVLICLIFGNTY